MVGALLLLLLSLVPTPTLLGNIAHRIQGIHFSGYREYRNIGTWIQRYAGLRVYRDKGDKC
jgi:hypothetical protein